MAYYVYNKSAGKPIKKHPTYESALQEAKRLARITSKKIEILEILTKIKANVDFEVTDFRRVETVLDTKPSLPFEIKSVFLAKDRLNELEEIPKLPNGDIDYWKASELLCEKDGGRLPTMEELAQLASYIYGKNIKPYEDYVDLEIKNMPPELKPVYEKQGWFALWSRREYSATYAYYRNFDTSYTNYDNNWRGYSSRHGVCLGE